jgi:hypothetical protein
MYYKRKIVSISVIEIYRDIISQGEPQKYGVVLMTNKRVFLEV